MIEIIRVVLEIVSKAMAPDVQMPTAEEVEMQMQAKKDLWSEFEEAYKKLSEDLKSA